MVVGAHIQLQTLVKNLMLIRLTVQSKNRELYLFYKLCFTDNRKN